METKNIADVARIFYYFADKIEKKIDPNDPSAARTQEYIKKIKKICAERTTATFTEEGTSFFSVFVGAVTVAGAAAAGYYYLYKKK